MARQTIATIHPQHRNRLKASGWGPTYGVSWGYLRLGPDLPRFLLGPEESQIALLSNCICDFHNAIS